jgi:ABC-type transporter Mla MlaB component
MRVSADMVEINIVVRRRLGSRRIVVTGDVDHCGALRLSHELAEVMAQHPDHVEVDLSGATLFCSTAVTALVRARRVCDDRLHVVAVAPVVEKVLRAAGMTTALTRAGV